MLSGDYILITHPSGDRSLHPQSLDAEKEKNWRNKRNKRKQTAQTLVDEKLHQLALYKAL